MQTQAATSSYPTGPSQGFIEPLPPIAAKIAQLNPSMIVGGGAHLFQCTEGGVQLTPPFIKLLQILIDLNELEPKAAQAASVAGLNQILQQPQAERGGLLRKEGTERWNLADNPALKSRMNEIESLFKECGFVSAAPIAEPLDVNHCLVFGARVERMEKRILETVAYLQRNLKVSGHIFLLGSSRKLVDAELDYLRKIIELKDKNEWLDALKDSSEATEANAFRCLWECLAPAGMADNVVAIKATRIGSSYRQTEGHRSTTETTVEDWMKYFREGEPQAIFAVVEQPFLRLHDQLRFSVATKAKKAKLEEIIDRLQQTKFHFAIMSPPTTPFASVVLDEVARNVYFTHEALKFFKGLNAS